MKRLFAICGVMAIGIVTSCASAPKVALPQPAPSYASLKLEELGAMEGTDPARALEACGALLAASGADAPAAPGPSADDIRGVAAKAAAKVYGDYT